MEPGSAMPAVPGGVIYPMPGPTMAPAGPVMVVRQWHSELFDCVGDGEKACKGLFCPCVVYGQNQELFDGTNCFCNTILWTLSMAAFPTHALLGGMRRQAMRNRFMISGDVASDVAAHLFCCFCALMQEQDELINSPGTGMMQQAMQLRMGA